MAMFDINNAFFRKKVNNEEDKFTVILIKKLEEYLVMIAPEMYNPYVVIEEVINIYI